MSLAMLFLFLPVRVCSMIVAWRLVAIMQAYFTFTESVVYNATQYLLILGGQVYMIPLWS